MAALTEHRKAYLRDYVKQYKQEHPDKAREWRTRSAISWLLRNGYDVTVPETFPYNGMGALLDGVGAVITAGEAVGE